MNTEAIDNALSELLQARWTWQYEERAPGSAKQIEEKAARLAADAPGVYAEVAQSLAAGLSEAPPLEFVRAVPPPDPDADIETPWAPVEALLCELPVDIDALEEAGAEQALERAAAAPAEAFAARARLPIRNQTANGAPHVQLFTQHGGLVHGGTITIGGSRLVCRAFSWFRHTSNRKLFGPGTSDRVHTVAGVCEQFNPAGALVERFSTAERLAEVYRTTSQPLLDGAWRATSALGTGEGFYATALTPQLALQLLRDAKKGGNAILPDSGVPDPQLYGGGDPLFAASPAPITAPENALFDKPLVGGGEGWVIKTPYLAVYAPDPRKVAAKPSSPHVPVIVAMLGVFRSMHLTVRGKGKRSVTNSRFERKAQWSVRSFRLPLPD